MGYSPWGCKELDLTERLTLSLSSCGREENVTGARQLRGFYSSLLLLQWDDKQVIVCCFFFLLAKPCGM